MTAPRPSQLVLDAVTAYPDSSVKDVAQRLNMDDMRVRNLLAHLEAYGMVQGALPPLMKRGKRYRVVVAP